MRTGRPRIPEHLKPVERTVRLSPAAFDAAYRVAVVQGISPNALLQRVLERTFTNQKTLEPYELCYGALQAIPSTLTGLVGAVPKRHVGSSAVLTTETSSEREGFRAGTDDASGW